MSRIEFNGVGNAPIAENEGIVWAFAEPREVHALKPEDLTTTAPAHEVLFNEDILPEIFFQLKTLFEENGWKRPVSQLLVINKAFFHAGVSILWQSMNSLHPAFKLLPWFTKPQYDGLGLETLRTLQLTITNAEGINGLPYLRYLPLLEDLTIEGLCMAIRKEDRRIPELPLGQEVMPKLQALGVFATHHSGDYPTTPRRNGRLLACAQQIKKLRSFSFIDAPYALATANAPLILTAMSFWTTITHVFFRVHHSESTEPATTPPSPPFPGLSFLASTVWKSCLNLLELEFHFDHNLVVAEDLTPSMNVFQCQSTFNHPLRELRINTGANKAKSDSLNLSQSRKADIAVMLDRLFPKLEVVGGSGLGGEQWNEVEVLVKAFRKQREFIFTEVEELLNGL